MRDIYDIVQDQIFAKMNTDVKILSFDAPSGGSQVVKLCNNKWIRVGQVLTDIDPKEWVITSIAANGDVTLTVPSGATALVKRQILAIKVPKFLFGSQVSANNEYRLRGQDSRVKLPLIWLVGNIKETEHSIRVLLERTSELRLFFLDDNNPKQFLTADYRLNVVSPMIALKDEFKRVIKKSPLFDVVEAWNTRTITRFGNEAESGVVSDILSDSLSGVELVVSLPIFKSGSCKC
jgi:hypothetical protein